MDTILLFVARVPFPPYGVSSLLSLEYLRPSWRGSTRYLLLAMRITCTFLSREGYDYANVLPQHGDRHGHYLPRIGGGSESLREVSRDRSKGTNRTSERTRQKICHKMCSKKDTGHDELIRINRDQTATYQVREPVKANRIRSNKPYKTTTTKISYHSYNNVLI